jgi:hypothetical protein
LFNGNWIWFSLGYGFQTGFLRIGVGGFQGLGLVLKGLDPVFLDIGLVFLGSFGFRRIWFFASYSPHQQYKDIDACKLAQEQNNAFLNVKYSSDFKGNYTCGNRSTTMWNT